LKGNDLASVEYPSMQASMEGTCGMTSPELIGGLVQEREGDLIRRESGRV